MIRLFNTDCMEFMKGVPDKAYDLAIADPPYGIGEDGYKNGSRISKIKYGEKHSKNGTIVLPKKYENKNWDKNIPPKKYFDELFRISNNQIVWGVNYFHDLLPDHCGRIVWDKTCHDKHSIDLSDGEIAYCSLVNSVRIFRYLWKGLMQGGDRDGTVFIGNLLKKEIRIHPTQKPVKLYRWLIKNYAKPGNRILDTHGGSMSIAIAAYDLGFDLDLCELDPDYFKEGKARYEAHVKKYAPAELEPVTAKGEMKLF